MPPRFARKQVTTADVATAFVALREFSKDPDRTDLVGEFIGSLTGPSAAELLEKVWDDPVGRAVLEERRDLSVTLKDRSYLASLPAGTLGRTYHDWTAQRDFTAEGIAEAIRAQVPRTFDGPEATLGARVVDMHDLWHVLNGWDSDVHGELHLLGYSYAQLGAYAWLALGLFSSLTLSLLGRVEGLGYLRDAVTRGREAVILAAVDWEAMLPLPLPDVRRRLQVRSPTPYRRLSLDEVREINREHPLWKFVRTVFPS